MYSVVQMFKAQLRKASDVDSQLESPMEKLYAQCSAYLRLITTTDDKVQVLNAHYKQDAQQFGKQINCEFFTMIGQWTHPFLF